MDQGWLDVAELLQISFPPLSAYAEQICTVHFAAGDIVYGPEQSFDGVYVVVDGLAKTVLSLRGKEVVTGFATRGDVLGTDALHSPTFVTKAVAATPLKLAKIPTDVFSELIRDNHEFREALHIRLAAAITVGFEMIELLAKARAEARLAFFLLNEASKAPLGDKEVDSFNIRLTRDEIASYLGLQKEAVSQGISSLAANGYVRLQGKRIKIKNRAALELLRSGKTIH